MISILVVDDEESQRKSIETFLRRREYKVLSASNGDEAFKLVEEEVVDLILSDLRMPGTDGLELLKKVKQFNPQIDVVVMTAYGSIDDAVSIMKSGAYDYLTKPIDLDELENLIKRVSEKRLLISENRLLREQLQDKFKFDSIVTQSKKMEDVLNLAGRVAKSKTSVLIRGESGTGKELVAKAIHFSGDRNDKPFVTVNIASLPENLMESELFGHEKGSFTGAILPRIGKFEEANGGTLFIDEVGDIPLSVQVKLLRAIQFNEIQRLGSNAIKKLNVRIIAATHRDLETMIKEGEFREDLYYRLNVVSLMLPKLNERKEDVPILIDHFINKYSTMNNKNVSGITSEALDRLMKYDYPGNIRELENMIERAVVLSRYEKVSLEDLPAHFESLSENKLLDPYNLEDDYEQKVKTFETEMIIEALKQNDGNQSAAARQLKITERHLRSRLERLGIKNKK